ncbi:MAG: tetratricopeptide repeat protein [Planctomycetota bacterium]
MRRKKTVAAVAAIALLLVGGLVGTGWGLSKALRAEADAKRDLARANEVTRVVKSMIEGAQPEVALGRDASILRGIADDTAERIAKGEIEDPFVAAELDEILGLTYISLSEFDASHFHYARAEAFYESEFGLDDRRTLGMRRCLVSLLAATNQYEKLLDVAAVLLDDVRRTLGDETNDVAMIEMMMGQAAAGLGRFELADRFIEDAIAISSRVNGDDALETSEVRRHLSWLQAEPVALRGVARDHGRPARAEERRGTDPNDPTWINLKGDKLVTLSLMGRVGEAADLANEVYEASSRILGPEHEKTIQARADLVIALREAGRIDEALELARENFDWYTRTVGAEDPKTLSARFSLAMTKSMAGDRAGARADVDEILPLAREHGMGSEVGQMPKFLNFAAIVVRQTGDGERSEELQLEAIDRMVDLWGIESRDTLGAITNLGWLYLQTGRPSEALEQFERSLPVKRRVLGPTHPFTRAALAGVANAKRALGDRDGALDAARELREAHLQLAEEDPRDLQSLHELLRSLLFDPLVEMRDAELAVRYSERAVQVTERADTDSLGYLATAYFAAGRPREALATANELLEKLEPGTDYYRQVERTREQYAYEVELLDAAEGDDGDETENSGGSSDGG